MKFTDDQLKAINAQGTVLVAAAAGSGKTAVLVERIIRRFCDETRPLMADRALIVTFTNAAAAELKTKITNALKEKLLENPSSDLLRRQCLLIETASICTIDSFCINLVRENFSSLGISRDFKIADSNAIEDEYLEILEEMFFEKYALEDEDFLKTISDFQIGYEDNNLKNIIKDAYSKSCAMPYQEEWFDSILERNKEASQNIEDSLFTKLIFEKIIPCAYDALLSAKRLKKVAVDDERFADKYKADIEARLNYITELYENLKNNRWQKTKDLVASYSNKRLKSNSSSSSIISSAITESKDKINNVNKIIMKNLDENLSDMVKVFNDYCEIAVRVVDLIKEYKLRIDAYSRENNTYTFDQIEHFALDLLKNHTSVADSFNNQYDAILVDEYQDTSNLQDELFRILSERKKQLFMVGDVKQSIYGFRNANPDNFLNKKDEYPVYDVGVNPAKVLLTGNFRSRKGICEFCNFIFNAYMTKADAGMEYNDEEKLDSLAQYVENNEESDVLLNIVETDPNTDKWTTEAKAVADYILETIAKEPFLSDGKNGLRKAEFYDFAILMRSPKNKIEYYASVFEKRGIPINCPSEKFSDSAEIKTALSLLKAVDNPNNDISVLALLTSPVFGFTHDEICSIRSCSPYATLYSNLMRLSETSVKCKNFVEFLSSARTLSITLPIDKLLIELFSQTAFYDVFGVMQNGELKKANLHLLCEFAAKFCENGDRGLTSFVKYIESEKNQSTSANVVSTSNAVQIMSIHTSKGLQFPICILCSLAGEFNKSDIYDSDVCDDNYGIAFKYYSQDFGAIVKPISYNAISNVLTSKLYKEELRLLYVAITRAKEKLALFVTVNNREKYLEGITEAARRNSQKGIPFIENSLSSAKSYADWIVTAAMCHKDGVVLRRTDEDFPVCDFDCKFSVALTKPSVEFEQQVYEENMENIIETVDLSDVFSYKYPYEYINSVPAKTSVTEILKTEKPINNRLRARLKFLSECGLTPAERGTAAHKFMEFCDYTAAAQDLEMEIERLYEWEYITKEEADAINREAIKAFFQSEIYKTLLSADKVYNEYRFMTKLDCSKLNSEIPENSGEYTLVQGVADCVAIMNDGIIILDYKTDNSDDEEYFKKEYSYQLELYSEAISKIFSMPIKRKVIYAFTLKKCIEI